MKQQLKNKIQALILIIVFSLNTVAGFACSIGIDLGYNSKHHEKGSSHSKVKTHSHETGHKHSSEVSPKLNHQHKSDCKSMTENNSKDDCCANEVTKFMQLDKSVVNSYLNLKAPTFFESFVSAFIQPLQSQSNFANNSGFQFVRRSCAIYDTDIRIAIQSFQI